MYKVWEDKVTISCWENAGWMQGKHTHPAWANMVDSIDEDLPYDLYCAEISRILKKYKAKMIRPSTYPHYMRFPNLKMAHWFLLEWM